MTTDASPVRVLMVDDDPTDVHLAKIILDDVGTSIEFHSCASADEGMSFLNQSGTHVDAPAPDFILLDLNMPGRDGFEFLEELRLCPHLPQRVIVLTTSARAADIHRAYGLGADLVVTKPTELNDYHDVMVEIEAYWHHKVAAPA